MTLVVDDNVTVARGVSLKCSPTALDVSGVNADWHCELDEISPASEQDSDNLVINFDARWLVEECNELRITPHPAHSPSLKYAERFGIEDLTKAGVKRVTALSTFVFGKRMGAAA